MINEKVLEYINEDCYRFVSSEEISEKFTDGYSLYQLIGQCLKKEDMSPMIIEYGQVGMGKILAEMRKNLRWSIDLAIIN